MKEQGVHVTPTTSVSVSSILFHTHAFKSKLSGEGEKGVRRGWKRSGREKTGGRWHYSMKYSIRQS